MIGITKPEAERWSHGRFVVGKTSRLVSNLGTIENATAPGGEGDVYAAQLVGQRFRAVGINIQLMLLAVRLHEACSISVAFGFVTGLAQWLLTVSIFMTSLAYGRIIRSCWLLWIASRNRI